MLHHMPLLTFTGQMCDVRSTDTVCCWDYVETLLKVDLQRGTFPSERSIRNRFACFHDLWVSSQSRITHSISDV